MHSGTLEIIKTAIKSDSTMRLDEKAHLLSVLKRAGKPDDCEQSTQKLTRIIRRREAAQLLGVSRRAVDAWAKDGVLHKIHVSGRRRAIGFNSEEVEALMQIRTEAPDSGKK